jgi:hypothetical protein
VPQTQNLTIALESHLGNNVETYNINSSSPVENKIFEECKKNESRLVRQNALYEEIC